MNSHFPFPILLMGLPGSGKTTIAKELSRQINAVHWNADEVRTNLNKDLGFSIQDRIEQAKRMRFLCDTVLKNNTNVIADFVCPTTQTREAFGLCFTVFVDRIKAGRFNDTNHLFIEPEHPNVVITKGMQFKDSVSLIVTALHNLRK